MAFGEPAAAGRGGSGDPPGQPVVTGSRDAAGTPRPASGLNLRLALVALLVAVALAGMRATVPGSSWAAGAWHRHGTLLGLILEAVLAVLLFVLERRRRRAPLVGQPAAGLRTLLRGGLIIGLVAIPALIAVNAAGQLRPSHPRPIRPPQLHGGKGLPPPPRPGSGFDLALVLYALIAAILLTAIVACIVVIVRRARQLSWTNVDELTGDDGEAEEQLRRAVQSGQAALRDVDDARLAIIACYVAMEQSLAQAGTVRAAAETPDELLARAATAGLVQGGEAARLTELFYEARFSSHPLPAQRRDEALQALDVLAASLTEHQARLAQAAGKAQAAP
jgi:hypothetical protein